VDINSLYWAVRYVDGSSDQEGSGRKWHELAFPLVEHFMLLPGLHAERKTVIVVEKDPDHCLIFRKQQHVGISGRHYGTDYLMGLEPDDGSLQLLQVEQGWRDPSEVAVRTGGFRCWLLRDGSLRFAGCLHKQEEVKNGYKIITLSI